MPQASSKMQHRTWRMEGEQSEVVLIGTWPSAFCTRVRLALEVKGIPYKYIEEDLENKSDLLLQCNPVHKKVPVLVHNGKPIAESLITFVVDVHENVSGYQIMPGTLPIILSEGKEREKAIEEYQELIKVFEEGIDKDFSAKSPFINGDSLGFLDIVVGTVACNYKALHEEVAVILEPEKHPSFFSWVTALKEHPLVQQVLPPHNKLVAKMKEKYFQSPNA
ncbi:hypothetical protein PTKIN_Ptkin17bG0157200 [Pterospermum kingtungense]